MKILWTIAILAIPVEEQRPGRAVCRLEVSAHSVSLSGELQVRITIEGTSPVEVDAPRPWTLSRDWSAGERRPVVTPLPNGRERWEQVVVFSPYQVGTVTLSLEPIRFRTGNEVLEWPLVFKPLSINVTSQIEDPDRESPRPVTDIIRLPPRQTGPGWRASLPFLALIGAGLGLLVVYLRRRRPAPMATPAELALRQMETWGQTGLTGAQMPDLADLLRQYLAAELDLATRGQTTEEFIAELQSSGRVAADLVQQIETLLRENDLVKFAQHEPTPEECQSFLLIARAAVGQVRQIGTTP